MKITLDFYDITEQKPDNKRICLLVTKTNKFIVMKSLYITRKNSVNKLLFEDCTIEDYGYKNAVNESKVWSEDEIRSWAYLPVPISDEEAEWRQTSSKTNE